MFLRCLFAAALFFPMARVLEAQDIPQPQFGRLTPAQQRQIMKAMQRQGMQPGMQPGMQAMQGVPFEAAGKLEAIGRGQVKIMDDNGKEWVISFNQQTAVKTTGEAAPEFLKPGMCVEFAAEVDAKGIVPGKVEELSIVTPSKERPSGVFPEGGGEAAKAAAKPAAKTAAAAKAKKGAAAGPAVMSKVVGHVKSAKSGKLLVQAGRTTVQFELGENAKISIDMADGAFASKGDKVEIKGMQMPNMPNQGQAQSITIALAEPLGLPKKKAEAGKSEPPRPPKAIKPKK
ncbi:MAG: hypothetical protein IT426_05235 [Pirellulales bacterium]|nr:hypothetical protein [Pirellulales bacterium]